MKIALVHEFLTQFGGAERVLQNFLAIWPQATVHVLVHNPDRVGHAFDGYEVKTSYVNGLPGALTDHKWYLALMPHAIGRFDLNKYDVVLSDASSFAKGAKTDRLHICYCHTPTRFLWTERERYLKATRYPGVIKWLARPVLKWVKAWDYRAAQRPDFFLANSRNVQDRIWKYYGRESEVIPPPVDTTFFHPVGERGKHFLVASRLEPYKRVDVVIAAFNQLGWPLKVAGTGTDLPRLKKLAGPTIEFLGRVSDEDLREQYSTAQAYVFPAEEDAGIMVLEAQACGTPVIAYGAGGALETIVEGVTGEFFPAQDAVTLTETLQRFDARRYDANAIRRHAQKYDKQIFQQQIRQYVEDKHANRT